MTWIDVKIRLPERGRIVRVKNKLGEERKAYLKDVTVFLRGKGEVVRPTWFLEKYCSLTKGIRFWWDDG